MPPDAAAGVGGTNESGEADASPDFAGAGGTFAAVEGADGSGVFAGVDAAEGAVWAGVVNGVLGRSHQITTTTTTVKRPTSKKRGLMGVTLETLICG